MILRATEAYMSKSLFDKHDIMYSKFLEKKIKIV